MRGFSRARVAAWLFRLVFYGGSLTLIDGWDSGPMEIDCGVRTWESSFWTRSPYERPSRYGFTSSGWFETSVEGFGSGTAAIVSSGTVTPDGACARGLMRITAELGRGPRRGCDSGSLSWSASRKP
jgi:hypothetical protein